TTTLGPISLVDPSISLSNFSFALSGQLSATVTVSAATATIGTATSPVSATFTNLAGSFDLGLQFDLSKVLTDPTHALASGAASAFSIKADSLTAHVGSYLTLTATGTQADPLTINPTAGANQDLISFATLGATLHVGAVNITGTASNFAIEGDGSFLAKTDFGVSISVGADANTTNTNAQTMGWPSWLPLQSATGALFWPHFHTDPTVFVMNFSAAINFDLIPGLNVSGNVTNVVMDVNATTGQFEITSIGALGVGVSGNLFGGTVSGTLVGGMVRIDANGKVVDGLGNLTGTTTPGTTPFRSAFYVGIEGGYNIEDLAGFTIRIG